MRIVIEIEDESLIARKIIIPYFGESKENIAERAYQFIVDALKY